MLTTTNDRITDVFQAFLDFKSYVPTKVVVDTEKSQANVHYGDIDEWIIGIHKTNEAARKTGYRYNVHSTPAVMTYDVVVPNPLGDNIRIEQTLNLSVESAGVFNSMILLALTPPVAVLKALSV